MGLGLISLIWIQYTVCSSIWCCYQFCWKWFVCLFCKCCKLCFLLYL